MCLRKFKKTVDASCYSSTPTLSMPTVREINKIEKDLESTDIKFCGSCLKENDKTSTIDVVTWIQYDRSNDSSNYNNVITLSDKREKMIILEN